MMRVVALDGLRWIASSHIVIFHRYRDWTGVPRVFAAWGQTWTQFFFIISGFVLGLSEIKKPPGAAEPSLSTYIIRRLRLLYPAYLLSLFFLLALHPHPTHFEWSVLPLHIKLLQSWFPWCVDLAGGNLNIQCSMEYWNRNSWFLSALLFFWIALRPVARALRERSVACNIVIAFCCWSASFVLEWFDHSHRLAAMVGCNEMLRAPSRRPRRPTGALASKRACAHPLTSTHRRLSLTAPPKGSPRTRPCCWRGLELLYGVRHDLMRAPVVESQSAL
mmetsp:Transcript_67880/g.133519  ORF Transcript_67880/g.133519 Transcript_67880/m.133519 type:complete len:276 (+) Transcript_67880:64-891(+)